ncbi:MAG: 4Fe-4S dicluster domain-containing protein [Alicyclobacillus sp.]|nr:4Fe-4S dicluster domain-containing protein [Alicyclobacillus sp.]
MTTAAPRNGAFLWPDAPAPEQYEVCVHCGFCLEVCPTYQEWRDENHSPRGRVFLIQAAAEGRLSLDAAVVDPVFTCLDCRACESVCPSGVPVGHLIEAARGQVYHADPPRGWRGALARLFLRGLFPHPRRLGVVRALLRLWQRFGLQCLAQRLGLLRLLPPHLRALAVALPEVTARPARLSLPERLPAAGPRKGRVALFTGCVMDVLFTPVHEATVRVAQRHGLEVVVPRDQVCCGALQVHAGDRPQAQALARRNITVFAESGVDYIAVNAAGCGAMLKEYPELFRGDPAWHARAQAFAQRVRDIAELLAEVGTEPPRGRVPQRATYHDACHLCHAQGVRVQPRQLLRSVPGLELVEMPDAERCCGSAGVYNLTHPEMAQTLLTRKLDDLPPGVEMVITGNPGCILQLRAGLAQRGQRIAVRHTVEVLDAAYQQEEEQA